MELRRLTLDQLKPAPYNPRLKLKPGDAAWEKLERSLREFDLVQPIVWNERTGHVVSGHQRLEVLKSQGQTEFECVVVDFPLAREKALNVALNNASIASDWDPARLHDLVAELQELPEIDCTLTGFDEAQVRDMLFEPVAMEKTLPDDAEPTDTLVHVHLDMPDETWQQLRAVFDELLAEHADLRLFVKMPGQ